MKFSEEDTGSREDAKVCRRGGRRIFLRVIALIVQSMTDAGLLQRAFSSLFFRKSRSEVPQCSYVEGLPDLGTLIYKQEVNRWSDKSYTFRFHQPSYMITGIACRPKSSCLQSPEAEVLEGGISYDHVTIQLTPLYSGHWSCVVDICGRPSDRTEKSQVWQTKWQ